MGKHTVRVSQALSHRLLSSSNRQTLLLRFAACARTTPGTTPGTEVLGLQCVSRRTGAPYADPAAGLADGARRVLQVCIDQGAVAVVVVQ